MTWRGRALIGLVMACLGFSSFAVLQTGTSYRLYQQDLEDNRGECEAERNAENHKHSKECQSFLYRTLDDPVAVLTAGLTVATVALFVVTFGLYAAAARQGADAQEAVRIARETSQTQLRAYVGVERVFLNNALAGRPITGTIIFKNYGQTPALAVRPDLALAVVPPGVLDFDLEDVPRDPVPGTLMPSDVSQVHFPFRGEEEKTLAQAVEGGMAI